MKKEKIEFDNLGGIDKIQVGKYEVDVKKYLSWQNQKTIIVAYLETYFDEGFLESETDYVGAERVFNLAVLDMATSVNVGLKKWVVDGTNMIVDYAEESGLMSSVRGKIKNLSQVRNMIERIVADTKEQRYSANGFIKQLTESVGELDFEKVKELGEQLKVVQEEAEDSPISVLLKEANKGT